MEGKWISVDNGEIFVRVTSQEKQLKEKNTILLLHGLGESGACFAEALDWLKEYKLVIPDLLGYGHSRASSDGDYSTLAQAKRIAQIIHTLELENIILIGHSWGGDVGTQLCLREGGTIDFFFNIEGDLHTDNVIMSTEAALAFKEKNKEEFQRWLWHDEFNNMTLKWDFPAAIRYFASVRLCNPDVFGKTVMEINGQHMEADNEGVLDWGHTFSGLTIPKVYCWGTKSLKEDSAVISFLGFNL